MPDFDFNIEFNYRINTPFSEDSRLPKPTTPSDWNNSAYTHYKTNLKKDHLRKQKGRCAYCRKQIEIDGYYEDLDHVIAKTIKPEWMIKPKNLVVACNACNRLKRKDATLRSGYVGLSFPSDSNDFIVFNPHFDQWSDHFGIEDDLFLVAKPNSKGKETIKICRLWRYHIPLNYAREKRLLAHPDTKKKLTQRLNLTTKGSQDYNSINQSIIYLIENS